MSIPKSPKPKTLPHSTNDSSPKNPGSQGSRSVRSAAVAPATDAVPEGSNFAVVRGLIRRSPEFRVLPSGDELLSFDLTVRGGELPAESVPVVWHNPSAAATRFAEGDDVVVVGRVRRRFFRVAGSTASRTEVHADKVLSSRSTARIRTALAPKVDELRL